MIWLLIFDAAGFVIFWGAVLADGIPYPRPHLPAALTTKFHRTTSGDR